MSNRRRARPRPPAHPMKVLAATGGLEFEPNHEASAWLADAIGALRARIMAGAIKACPHLRPGMVSVTALWAPDRMVCTPCLPMLAVTGNEDRRCDRCGVIVAAGHLHPGMTSLDPSGALLVLLGLCSRCMHREVAS
jgi:hypothetical protein